MEIHKYNMFIPLEVNDIIQPEGFNNVYKLVDIVHIYSCKQNSISNVILILEDVYNDIEIKLPYKDYKWNILPKGVYDEYISAITI